jgi:chaperonin GroES
MLYVFCLRKNYSKTYSNFNKRGGSSMSDVKLRPLGDRVWVEPIEREEMTASGIVLPETAKEKPMEGRILAVGPGARNEHGERSPLDVKVGDKVLFAKYAGTEFKHIGSKYLIMRESDLLAVID